MRSNKFSLSTWFALSLVVFSVISVVDANFSGQAEASKSLFKNFVNRSQNNGWWSGKGSIILKSGETETLKCRATYFLSNNGIELKQNLRCASSSYRITAKSEYQTNGGKVTGDWVEETFNIRGRVSGQSKGNKLNLAVSGDHINANMTIVVKKCSQLIKILPKESVVTMISMRFGRC